MTTIYLIHYLKTPSNEEPETISGASEVWEATGADGVDIWHHTNIWHRTKEELIDAVIQHLGNECQFIESKISEVPEEYLSESTLWYSYSYNRLNTIYRDEYA